MKTVDTPVPEVKIRQALKQPQKADANEHFNSPLRDWGTHCARFTFEGRAVPLFMNEEIWKAVAGYEGLYEVSNLGNVRSVDRIQPHSYGRKLRVLKGQSLKWWIDWAGYKIVGFSKNGVVKNKDGNKLNNHISNLEHVSYSENNQHAFDTGLKKPTNNHGEMIGTHKMTNAKVLELRSLANCGGMNGARLGRLFGISTSTACRIISKKTWTHL